MPRAAHRPTTDCSHCRSSHQAEIIQVAVINTFGPVFWLTAAECWLSGSSGWQLNDPTSVHNTCGKNREMVQNLQPRVQQSFEPLWSSRRTRAILLIFIHNATIGRQYTCARLVGLFSLILTLLVPFVCGRAAKCLCGVVWSVYVCVYCCAVCRSAGQMNPNTSRHQKRIKIIYVYIPASITTTKRRRNFRRPIPNRAMHRAALLLCELSSI